MCSYNCIKDVLLYSAVIQNMLPTAYEMEIENFWIGDLLGKADAINKLLEIDDYWKLMGIVSLGY